jgi:hypothetical protein
MTEKEAAFWDWWKKIEPYKENYNLRMAFDAGYDAKKGDV